MQRAGEVRASKQHLWQSRSRPNSVVMQDIRASDGLQRIGPLLAETYPDLIVSKQKLRQAEAVQLVRAKRERATQNLRFASRPFVLCGLPVKRPRNGTLIHERRNGKFVLQVTGHPEYSLPWGQDCLVPIFLATLAIRQQSQTISFVSAAEMLDTFGMHQGGAQYRRLIEAFKRVFGATIFSVEMFCAGPVEAFERGTRYCGRGREETRAEGSCESRPSGVGKPRLLALACNCVNSADPLSLYRVRPQFVAPETPPLRQPTPTRLLAAQHCHRIYLCRSDSRKKAGS